MAVYKVRFFHLALLFSSVSAEILLFPLQNLYSLYLNPFLFLPKPMLCSRYLVCLPLISCPSPYSLLFILHFPCSSQSLLLPPIHTSPLPPGACRRATVHPVQGHKESTRERTSRRHHRRSQTLPLRGEAAETEIRVPGTSAALTHTFTPPLQLEIHSIWCPPLPAILRWWMASWRRMEGSRFQSNSSTVTPSPRPRRRSSTLSTRTRPYPVGRSS